MTLEEITIIKDKLVNQLSYPWFVKASIGSDIYCNFILVTVLKLTNEINALIPMSFEGALVKVTVQGL